MRKNTKENVALFVKHHWSLILAITFLIALIITLVLSFRHSKNIMTEMSDTVEYNMKMNELFIALQEKNMSRDELLQKRSDFIIYGGSLIEQCYIEHFNKNLRQLSADERVELLEEIYSYAKSYDINPFLPLAYAYVETRFYPDIVGKDGERSIFQFMDSTARNTYAELHQQYIPTWYNSQKEAVKLWFAHYRKISTYFVNRSEEENIRFTAIAYNAGLYRNGLIYYYNNNLSIDGYLSDYPLKRGIRDYNKNVYLMWIKYKEKFNF